jgi:outer membrane receptor protein involved in Fe transport
MLTLDLHADYPLAVGKTQMRLFMDVFNVLDRKPVTQYVDTVELVSGVTDPNYGRAAAYVPPRTVRFGLRWDF